MNDSKKVIGKRILKIRNYLGLTQEEFAHWLKDHDVLSGRETLYFDGSDSFTYTKKAVSSWENGKRQVPTKVLTAIRDNVKYEGKTINWSYLIGESNYITNEVTGIIDASLDILDDYNKNQSKWKSISSYEDFQALAKKQERSILWYNIVSNEILPYFNYNIDNIFDKSRFVKTFEEHIKKFIEDFIDNEKIGK